MEINGLDVKDVMSQLKRRSGRYLALLLSDIEEEMVHEPECYQVVRKLILDAFNDYTRSIVRVVFGEDIEGLNFR